MITKFNRYRDQLYALRSQLDPQTSPIGAETEDAFDAADRAEQQTDIALNIGLATHEAAVRKEIDDALERMEACTFGICERCQAVIGTRRLGTIPYARYCVRCEREVEKVESEGN